MTIERPPSADPADPGAAGAAAHAPGGADQRPTRAHSVQALVHTVCSQAILLTTHDILWPINPSGKVR
jgi:hypothetical protein